MGNLRTSGLKVNVCKFTYLLVSLVRVASAGQITNVCGIGHRTLVKQPFIETHVYVESTVWFDG